MHSVLLLYRSIVLAPEAPDSTGGSDRGSGGGVGEDVTDIATHAAKVVQEVIDIATHSINAANHTTSKLPGEGGQSQSQSAKTADDTSVDVDGGNERNPLRTTQQSSTPGGGEWVAAQALAGSDSTAAEEHEAADSKSASNATVATGDNRQIDAGGGGVREDEASAAMGVDDRGSAQLSIFDIKMMTPGQQQDAHHVVGQLNTEVTLACEMTAFFCFGVIPAGARSNGRRHPPTRFLSVSAPFGFKLITHSSCV